MRGRRRNEGTLRVRLLACSGTQESLAHRAKAGKRKRRCRQLAAGACALLCAPPGRSRTRLVIAPCGMALPFGGMPATRNNGRFAESRRLLVGLLFRTAGGGVLCSILMRDTEGLLLRPGFLYRYRPATPELSFWGCEFCSPCISRAVRSRASPNRNDAIGKETF